MSGTTRSSDEGVALAGLSQGLQPSLFDRLSRHVLAGFWRRSMHRQIAAQTRPFYFRQDPHVLLRLGKRPGRPFYVSDDDRKLLSQTLLLSGPPGELLFDQHPAMPWLTVAVRPRSIPKYVTRDVVPVEQLPATRLLPPAAVLARFAEGVHARDGRLLRWLARRELSTAAASRVLTNAVYGALDALVIELQLEAGTELALLGPSYRRLHQRVVERLGNVPDDLAPALAASLLGASLRQLDGARLDLPLCRVTARQGTLYLTSTRPREPAAAAGSSADTGWAAVD